MTETTGDPRYTKRYCDALSWAADLHATQRRKCTNIPYVAHLLNASALVWLYEGNEDQAIAALLHDAVEDQGGAPVLAEILWRYGERVAAIVDACTDADVTPKPPWTPRKKEHIASITAMSEDALLVTLADKYDNVTSVLHDYREIGDNVWDRFTGGREGTVWYYQQMADALRDRMPGSILVGRLDGAVAQLGGAAGLDPRTAQPPE